MQDDYYEAVARKHGLERGTRGGQKKATHQQIDRQKAAERAAEIAAAEAKRQRQEGARAVEDAEAEAEATRQAAEADRQRTEAEAERTREKAREDAQAAQEAADEEARLTREKAERDARATEEAAQKGKAAAEAEADQARETARALLAEDEEVGKAEGLSMTGRGRKGRSIRRRYQGTLDETRTALRSAEDRAAKEKKRADDEKTRADEARSRAKRADDVAQQYRQERDEARAGAREDRKRLQATTKHMEDKTFEAYNRGRDDMEKEYRRRIGDFMEGLLESLRPVKGLLPRIGKMMWRDSTLRVRDVLRAARKDGTLPNDPAGRVEEKAAGQEAERRPTR